MPTPPDNAFLTRPLLRQLAGEEAYVAGEHYLGDGCVRQVQCAADRVTARVSGSRVHRVKIWRARGELHFSCGCPAGRDNTFCKHCAAVGLAWVQSAERADAGQGDPAVATAASHPDTRFRTKLQRHLRGLARDRLVNLLLEATDYDDILRRRLLMEAIGVAGPGAGDRGGPASPDFNAYRQILQEAIDAPDYVDYDAMPDYVHGVAEAIQPLGELLRAGHPGAVVDLVELALVGLDRASEMIDASDGSLNAVYDDLQRYHLEACRAARLAPEALAERLLHFELEGGLGVFNNAAKTYAEVLGPVGVAAWQLLLRREWANLPTLPPARSGRTPGSLDHRRFQIQALLETLAIEEGDLATLSAVKQRDLSSPHDYLSLAEWHAAAGRPDDALSWAERGRRAFPDSLDPAGLEDFLAAAYRQAGRQEDAVSLVWNQFARSQTLPLYQQLRRDTAATREGWPTWRVRALTLTRENLGRQRNLCLARGWPEAPDHSLPVELLLDDGADDDAWQEAQTGGCGPELWLRLAERREQTHPADALQIYQARLGPIIARSEPRAYREAIELLGRIGALLEGMGRAAEVDGFRAEVRATHRQKRTFVKLLDASWP